MSSPNGNSLEGSPQSRNSFRRHLIKPEDDDNRPTREALHWLIALQEDPSDAGVQASVERWPASDAENRRAWDEAQRLWGVLGQAREAASRPIDAQATTSRRCPAPPPSGDGQTEHRVRGRPLAIVAFAFSLAWLVIILQPAATVWLHADFATGVAETRDIRLSDGSVVFLGATSAIKVEYDANRRRVQLLSGQAYFEVQKDARPFQVGAGAVDITDIGTAFDVRLRSDGVSIAVNRGRVSVHSPTPSPALATPLGAGDWARVEWSGAVQRGADAPELAGGWRSGLLSVRDQNISDVLDEIERRYRGRIIIATAGLTESEE